MKTYELSIILGESLTSPKKKKALEGIDSLIEKNGGQNLGMIEWGKRDLAYPISKQTEGSYYFYSVNLPPKKVSVVNREVELNTDILRHLLVIATNQTTAKIEQVGKVKAKKKVKKEKKVK